MRIVVTVQTPLAYTLSNATIYILPFFSKIGENAEKSIPLSIALPTMYLSAHSLLQIDDSYLDSLVSEDLLALSKRLLADLKEARERLNQGPSNSSRPPSSQTPWERLGAKDDDVVEEKAETAEKKNSTKELGKKEEVPPAAVENKQADEASTEPATTASARTPKKPGKQPGAPGFGRTQVFTPNEVVNHYPEFCAGCSQPSSLLEEMVAYTAYQTVDVLWGDPKHPGLRCNRSDPLA